MRPVYEHRQSGTLTVGVLVAVMFALLSIAIELPGGAGGPRITFAVVAVVLLLVLLLFSSLTVTVDHETILLRFGIGLVYRRFRTAHVLEAKPVRNKWWYGWGIRLTPHGWLFNVSGLDAVELLMANGRRYRIGTDEPQKLAAAITSARHKTGDWDRL